MVRGLNAMTIAGRLLGECVERNLRIGFGIWDEWTRYGHSWFVKARRLGKLADIQVVAKALTVQIQSYFVSR